MVPALSHAVPQVYRAYLLPLEHRLPPSVRPTRAAEWMALDAESTAQAQAAGMAPTREQV